MTKIINLTGKTLIVQRFPKDPIKILPSEESLKYIETPINHGEIEGIPLCVYDAHPLSPLPKYDKNNWYVVTTDLLRFIPSYWGNVVIPHNAFVSGDHIICKQLEMVEP